jgi:hypothetical protein
MTQTLTKRHVVAGPDVCRSLFALAVLGLAACSGPIVPRPLAQRELAAPCGVVTLCAIPSANDDPLPTAYTNAIPIGRRAEYRTALFPVNDTTALAGAARR